MSQAPGVHAIKSEGVKLRLFDCGNSQELPVLAPPSLTHSIDSRVR